MPTGWLLLPTRVLRTTTTYRFVVVAKRPGTLFRWDIIIKKVPPLVPASAVSIPGPTWIITSPIVYVSGRILLTPILITPEGYPTGIRNVAINKMRNMSIYEYNGLGVKTPNYFSPAVSIKGLYPATCSPVTMANAVTNQIIGNRAIPTFNVQYQIVPRTFTKPLKRMACKYVGDDVYSPASLYVNNFTPWGMANKMGK